MKQAIFSFLLSFLLVLTLNFEVTAQEDKRCETNRKLLADYKTQIEETEIEADVVSSVKAEEEKYRIYLSNLNKAIANTQLLPGLTEISDRKRDAEILYLDWKESWTNDQQAFQKAIRIRLQQVLTEVKNPNILIQRQATLKKKVEEHEKKLKLYKCIEKAIAVCTMLGSWKNETPGIGTSTWIIDEAGVAKEQGMGGATGTAIMSGNILKIEWTHPNTWSGTYEWKLGPDCQSGEGTLTFKSGGSGTHNSTVTKQ